MPDLFADARLTDPEIAELARRTTVVADDELNKLFPDFYASIIQIRTKAGKTLERRQDVARGYPETPMTQAELDAKFRRLVGSVASSQRLAALDKAIARVDAAKDVTELAGLLSAKPDA